MKRTLEEEKQWQKFREILATVAGLTFHAEMRKACDIPYSGATGRAYQAIEEIDPRVWEMICYNVADAILAMPEIQVTAKAPCFPGTDEWGNKEDYRRNTQHDLAEHGWICVLPKESGR